MCLTRSSRAYHELSSIGPIWTQCIADLVTCSWRADVRALRLDIKITSPLRITTVYITNTQQFTPTADMPTTRRGRSGRASRGTLGVRQLDLLPRRSPRKRPQEQVGEEASKDAGLHEQASLSEPASELEEEEEEAEEGGGGGGGGGGEEEEEEEEEEDDDSDLHITIPPPCIIHAPRSRSTPKKAPGTPRKNRKLNTVPFPFTPEQGKDLAGWYQENLRLRMRNVVAVMTLTTAVL